MKNQVSLEFIMITILLISALLIVSVFSSVKNQEIQDLNLKNEAEKVLLKAGDAIHTAFLEGDGFSMNATLPQKILNFNYTLTASANFLTLQTRNTTFSRHLLTQNISGQFRKGENTLRNVNGGVKIL